MQTHERRSGDPYTNRITPLRLKVLTSNTFANQYWRANLVIGARAGCSNCVLQFDDRRKEAMEDQAIGLSKELRDWSANER